MPTSRPPNQISLSTFRTRPPVGKHRVTLPRRVKQLIELMVWGDPDADVAPMSVTEAARYMKISNVTAKGYLRHAGGRAHYLACLTQLRDSERARNLHTAIGIRDDSEMKKSAAGNRVRLESARFLEGEPDDRRNTNSGAASIPGIVIMINTDRSVAVDETVIEVSPVQVPDSAVTTIQPSGKTTRPSAIGSRREISANEETP